jgi:hypothetical protein
MRRRAGLAGLVGAGLLLAAGASALPGTAAADTRPPAGVPATVSADALPTVQVDGVVWSQAVVGTRVYAGGSFTNARPAGAAPGTHLTRRTNLLAYDIRTGVLVTSFAHTLNGQVLSVAASPDGKRVYIGGDFTKVDGATRLRIAAFDTATGKLVPGFAPRLGARARAVVATATTVYVGGTFSTANGAARSRLAAFNAANGHLLRWAPQPNDSVNALVLTPGNAALVVGGRFTVLGGRASYGLGKVDAIVGGYRHFPANAVVRDAGKDAAITSLSTDGKLVYGTGYVFGRGGNLEGSFAARPDTGALVWLEDCHGDSYSGAPVGGAFYLVGHAHDCSTVGGWPQTNPLVYHRAIAFTTDARGTVAPNTTGHYADFGGKPAPQLLHWFPDLAAGTFTQQFQAAWSVAATSSYVVLGGEFPSVNGRAQQGLVRFAVSALAPNKQGPRGPASTLALSGTSAAGTASLHWTTTYDRDNQRLTYTLTRAGRATPVWSGSVATWPWTLAGAGATETGLAPGTYTYQLTVADPFGNVLRSASVPVTVPAA